MKRLDLQGLRQIEAELNEVLYRDLPLASALSDILIAEILFERRAKRRLHWLLGTAAERLHGLFGATVEMEIVRTCEGPCRYLVTWTGIEPRFTEIVLPLLAALENNQSVVAVAEPSQIDLLSDAAGAILNDAGRFHPTKEWRREYYAARGRWVEILRGFERQGFLSKRASARILDTICLQSQRLEVCLRTLRLLRPRVVVTESDRSLRNSPLILAARELGIPTFTLVHGIITRDYGYTPVLADKILCWGEIQRRILIETGTEPSRVVSVGFPRKLVVLRRDGEKWRAALGVSSGEPLVVLATNPIRKEWRHTLVETIAAAFPPGCGIRTAVRLHPAERVNTYRQVMAKYPNLVLIPAGEWRLESALAAADVVVCHNSGISTEALLAETPLVLLDVLPIDLGANRDLAETLDVPVARSVAELRERVFEILEEKHDSRMPSLEKNKALFFASTGDDAINNIVREICRVL